MLEMDCIQQKGFRNVSAGGEITGFQFTIRSLYYRGVWLSQLRPSTVVVDGVTYGPETLTWTICGQSYTHAQMKTLGKVFWNVLDPATITVSAPGGLKPGVHHIAFTHHYVSSYVHPSVSLWGGTYERDLILM